MKKTTQIIFLSTSLLFSQDMPQMNEQNMQVMMQEMQKMQACMAKVDFNSLASLQEKSFSVQKEVEQMCSSGKKKKAQEIAINFSKEVMALPAIIQLKECSKNSPMGDMMNFDAKDFDKKHICDGQKVDFGVPSKKRVDW